MTVLERFLKYVSFETTSDEHSTSVPSTACQKVLGAAIAEEMRAMGLENAHMDEMGYVYGWLPASEGQEDAPVIGLIAHMDTSPAVSGKDIKAKVVHYEGGDIVLNDKESISLSAYPFLAKYAGQDIVVTDGTTLLGSDDKAGMAEILSCVEYLLENPQVAHGRIAICFTPDEEIGSGADHFDIPKFGAEFAYTVDGGELGELEYENFNGASADFTIHGLNIHPGSAKNKMKNAVLLMAELISMFPAAETPAHTEGYEGFYHVCDIKGDESLAEMHMIIRDHDREKFEQRKAFVRDLTDYLSRRWGEGTLELRLKDSYYNMREKIEPHMYIIDRAQSAMKTCGVTPEVCAIRGGTDGARLSFEGLPCPNLSTGGANFHGIHEFIPVPSMEKMVEVLMELVKA
ncbi:MAG: peptidase T [Clostridia bacterium]|nr:peptidase T [Clostridia bacterium]